MLNSIEITGDLLTEHAKRHFIEIFNRQELKVYFESEIKFRILELN